MTETKRFDSKNHGNFFIEERGLRSRPQQVRYWWHGKPYIATRDGSLWKDEIISGLFISISIEVSGVKSVSIENKNCPELNEDLVSREFFIVNVNEVVPHEQE